MRVAYGVKGFDHLRLRRPALHLFAPRVRVAERQCGRRSRSEYQRIGGIDQDFARQVLGAGQA